MAKKEAKSTARICKWLIDLLMKRKYIKLHDIVDLWSKDSLMKDYNDLSERNFHRYKDMLKRRFGVEIECDDGRGYAYYISNPSVFNDPNVPRFLLNTLALDEKLQECLSMIDRIRVEYVPSGGERLDVVTNAMLVNKKLEFGYQKYGSPKRNDVKLGVCGLILYNQRWYILGEFEDKSRYTYALDRMWNPKVSKEDFYVDPSFNVHHYFEEIYGIYNSGKPLTNIIIRAFAEEAYSMRDLPIHPSQKQIGSGENYTDYMIRVRPNNELLSYLLGRKDRVKVLSPTNFQEELIEALDSIRDLYDNPEKN